MDTNAASAPYNWDPGQYGKFEQERLQPGLDLMQLVWMGSGLWLQELAQRTGVLNAVDLGCGTGQISRMLSTTLGMFRAQPDMQGLDTSQLPADFVPQMQRVATGTVYGLDNSPEMLAQARSATQMMREMQSGQGIDADSVALLHFLLQSIEDFLDHGIAADETQPDGARVRQFALIFSNAALQYVPDHAQLFARLFVRLLPGGQLAVQMPSNDDHPAYALAAQVAAESPFAEALAGYVRKTPVLPPERYASLLHKLGYEHATVRLQVYGHELGSTEAVLEWMRGTLLLAYQKRLSADIYALFLDHLRERLLEVEGAQSPYLFTFKRVFIHAVRPGLELPQTGAPGAYNIVNVLR